MGSPGARGGRYDGSRSRLRPTTVEGGKPADGEPGDGDDVIGIWTTSERQKVRVFDENSGSKPINTGRWVQVSRLGNPLVNEVVVPLKAKDVFNTLEPRQDADVFPTLSAPETGSTDGAIPLVTDPILANQLQGVDPNIPSGDRQDLVATFLTGIEGLNKQANVRPSEILRLNTAIAPKAFGQEERLGVLAGDNAGFPNGRRPNDLGDGVNGPDKPFLTAFPYLAHPYSGFDDINNQLRVHGPGRGVRAGTAFWCRGRGRRLPVAHRACVPGRAHGELPLRQRQHRRPGPRTGRRASHRVVQPRRPDPAPADGLVPGPPRRPHPHPRRGRGRRGVLDRPGHQARTTGRS